MDLIQIPNIHVAQEVISGANMFNNVAMKEWTHNEDYPRVYPDDLKLHNFHVDINDNIDLDILNPVMQREPKIHLVNVIGNLLTLSSVFSLTVPVLKIAGNIQSEYLALPATSTFEAVLENIKIDVLAGLYIDQDSFSVDNIAHDLKNFDISFSYENASSLNSVFPLDMVSNKNRKAVETYIATQFLENTISLIYKKIKNVVVFDQVGVSDFLGGDYSHRDILKSHKQKLTSIFNTFLDTILKQTNEQFSENTMDHITIRRDSETTIHLDSNKIVIFANVDIDNSNLQKFHHPLTSNSYIKVSLRRIINNQIELNLDEFKIRNLSMHTTPVEDSNPEELSRLNQKVQTTTKQMLENVIQRGINSVIKKENMILFAANPSNLDNLLQNIQADYGRDEVC